MGSKAYIDESDMRLILMPLANLASESGIVVITVGPFNRREKGTDPMQAVLGGPMPSLAWRVPCTPSAPIPKQNPNLPTS